MLAVLWLARRRTIYCWVLVGVCCWFVAVFCGVVCAGCVRVGCVWLFAGVDLIHRISTTTAVYAYARVRVCAPEGRRKVVCFGVATGWLGVVACVLCFTLGFVRVCVCVFLVCLCVCVRCVCVGLVCRLVPPHRRAVAAPLSHGTRTSARESCLQYC